MIKFQEMQESDGSLQALFSKAKQNDSRYCISNDLLYKRESEARIKVIIVEEERDMEQFELPLIGDVERVSGEFIVEERLTRQQRGQLLDHLDEYKDRFVKIVGRTDIVKHKIRLKGVPYTRRMYSISDSL